MTGRIILPATRNDLVYTGSLKDLRCLVPVCQTRKDELIALRGVCKFFKLESSR